MSVRTIKLGEVCEFVYGDSLKEERRHSGKVPVFGSNGIVGWHNQATTSGPTIVIGRKGSIGEINWSNEPCFPIDTTYFVEKTKQPCDLRWLYFMLLKLDLTRLNKSAAIPGLNREDAYEQRIPSPDLSEQKRIAGLLEQADRLRRTRRYALELSDTFLPAAFIELFGDPVRNERGWRVVPVVEVGTVSTGGTPSGSEPGMFGQFVPFITPGDLEKDTLHSERFLSEAGAVNVGTVRAGTTLVCCIGATIGKTDKTRVRSAFNQQINAIEWDSTVEDDFGLYLMRFFSRVVVERGHSTTLPILKKSSFEDIVVPVPPQKLQQHFVALVKRHERLRASEREALRQADHLFHSSLHRAFVGTI